MNFTSLTPSAEKLLEEILSHRLDNGICDTAYWEKRFEGLSLSEELLLKSTFNELSDAEMIKVDWGDNVPYILVVLNNGLSYFDIKIECEKREKREKRTGRWHDLMMVIAGAILGGIVEFILFRYFGIGG